MGIFKKIQPSVFLRITFILIIEKMECYHSWIKSIHSQYIPLWCELPFTCAHKSPRGLHQQFCWDYPWDIENSKTSCVSWFVSWSYILRICMITNFLLASKKSFSSKGKFWSYFWVKFLKKNIQMSKQRRKIFSYRLLYTNETNFIERIQLMRSK